MHFAFEFLCFIDGPEFSLLKDEDLKATSSSEGQRTPTQSEYEIFECENINDFQDYQKVTCSFDVNSNSYGGKPLQSNSNRSKSWSNGSNGVSKNDFDTANGNGHANNNGAKQEVNGSNGISDMSISYQSLPPISSNGETDLEKVCSDVSNVCIDNDSSRNDSSTSEDNSKDANDTESNYKIPAALSKSSDTRAIKIINMNGNHSDRLASSLDTRTSLKSQPISVPSSTNSRHTKASSAECLLEGETNNNGYKSVPRNGRAKTNESVSCASITGGSLGGYSSSWQMIGSSPSSFCVPPISSSIKKGREARVRRTSSMASSEPSLLNSTLDSQQSHNGSAPKPTAQVPCDQTASSSGSSDDTASEYQSKLQRRRERLQTVRNQMLSAYLKALNDIFEKQKGGLSYYMNRLMGST